MNSSMISPRIGLALAISPLLFACSGSSDKNPPTAINTLPQLTSDTRVAVDENERGDFFALRGSDADGDALSFAVTGADAQHFAIDPDTGALRFRQPVNFEMPADSDGDNLYELTAVAEDARGGRQTQALTVDVTNVEFAYEFLSPLPNTIVERERYSRLPIALWMEYDYPERVQILCDGEIMNPASDSRMTWTGSIQLGFGQVNVECVFWRGEQVMETLRRMAAVTISSNVIVPLPAAAQAAAAWRTAAEAPVDARRLGTGHALRVNNQGSEKSRESWSG